MVAASQRRPPAAAPRQIVGGGKAEHGDHAGDVDQQRAKLEPVAARRDQGHKCRAADRAAGDAEDVDNAIRRHFVAAGVAWGADEWGNGHAHLWPGPAGARSSVSGAAVRASG
jgi:hypothetical protein